MLLYLGLCHSCYLPRVLLSQTFLVKDLGSCLTVAFWRECSNPMAGMDATLLALSGAGYADGKCFGFASCERRAGAAEGVNVLMERRLKRADGEGYEYAYNVTNVEYTEFGRLGVSDECLDGSSQYSRYPANTNVLYIGLKVSTPVIQPAIPMECGDTVCACCFGMTALADSRIGCCLIGRYLESVEGWLSGVTAGGGSGCEGRGEVWRRCCSARHDLQSGQEGDLHRCRERGGEEHLRRPPGMHYAGRSLCHASCSAAQGVLK